MLIGVLVDLSKWGVVTFLKRLLTYTLCSCSTFELLGGKILYLMMFIWQLATRPFLTLSIKLSDECKSGS
jgi:hypothetical protein